MTALHSENYKGFTLNIYQDEDAEDPRTGDNVCSFVCFHGRYNLGDKDHGYRESDYSSWKELEAAIVKKEKPVVILPLFLYDHSGLRLKIGSFAGLLPQGHAEFDSGQVGFVYLSRVSWWQAFERKRTSKKQALSFIEGEVRTYDAYLSGSVYGYTVEKDDETIDSCWGFFGEYPLDEAKQAVEAHLTHEAKNNGVQTELQLA